MGQTEPQYYMEVRTYDSSNIIVTKMYANKHLGFASGARFGSFSKSKPW